MSVRPSSAVTWATLLACLSYHAAMPSCAHETTGERATYQVQQPSETRTVLSLSANAEVITERGATPLAAVFASDGQSIIAVHADGVVRRSNLDPGRSVTELTRSPTPLLCAAISAEGRRLAAVTETGAVVLLDFSDEQRRFRSTDFPSGAVTLSFDHRGDRLAGIDSDGMLHVCSMSTGKVLSKVTQMRGPVPLLRFSPNDNRLAIASLAGDLRVLDLAGDEPALELQRQYPQVTAIAFSPDGRQLAVAHTKGQVSLLDLTADASIALTGHTFAVWGLTFDERNQRLATASWDGTIKLWDRQTGELLFSQKGHEESVSVLRFGPQDQLLSASLDGSIKLWLPDVPARRASAIISGVSDSVWVSTFSPDGKRLFVGGRNQRFEIWNMNPPQLMISQPGDGTTRCAAFSPDGSVLATGSDDRTVSLWDVPSGKRLQRMGGHPGAVSAVLFSLDGTTLISACDGRIVKLWDVTSGDDRATLQGHHHQIYCAALSPNGKTLLTGGGNWTNDAPGELLVWELESAKLIRRLDADRLALWTIAYAPDGKTFATSSSAGTVNVRDASTLELKRSLPHSMWIRSMAFSPDGQSLAVGRGDGSVRIWDTTTWQQRICCDGHSSFTFFLQFSADGKTLVSAGNDGTVRFWDPRQLLPVK